MFELLYVRNRAKNGGLATVFKDIVDNRINQSSILESVWHKLHRKECMGHGTMMDLPPPLSNPLAE